MKLTKGDIIKIHWKDAQTIMVDLERIDEKELKPLDVISVGIFIKQKRDCIVFSEYKFLEEETSYKYIHVIPKGMIAKIKVLEKAKVRK